MEELTAELWTAGELLISFARRSSRWIKRRIDQVKFDDDRTGCRTTTLDIELSDADLDALPTLRGRTLLPVKTLTRDVDVDPTVRDVDGVPLPQLTRRRERSFIAAGLLQYYRGEHVDPTEIYVAILSHIDERLYGPALDLRTIDKTFLDQVERFKKERLLIAAVDLRDERSPSEDADGTMFRLLVTLSEVLPERSTRRATSGGGAPIAPLVLDDFALRFPVDQLITCESFHFELAASEGTYVKEAKLVVRTATNIEASSLEEMRAIVKANVDPSEFFKRFTRTVTVSDDDPHPDRMHVFYSVDPLKTADYLIEAYVVAVLRPMTMGMMRAGLFSSLLGWAVLVSLLTTVGWIDSPMGRVASVNFGWNQEAIVAVLLLGPTLLSTVIIRQGEHLMTKRAVFGYRTRLGLQAFTTFAAAFVYAVGVPARGVWWLLVALVVTSSVAAGGTLRSYILSAKFLKSARLADDTRVSEE